MQVPDRDSITQYLDSVHNSNGAAELIELAEFLES